MESFASELPKWLAGFRHLETLAVWIPVACADGTGPSGEDEGPMLYDNNPMFTLNSSIYSMILGSHFRAASLFPDFFVADEDSKPIYCEYARHDWLAEPGKVMDWSRVARFFAECDRLRDEMSEESASEDEDGGWEADVSEGDSSEDFSLWFRTNAESNVVYGIFLQSKSIKHH